MSTLRQPNQGWWYKPPWQQYKLWTDGVGSSSADKTLGALGDSELNMSQHWALAAKTDIGVQGWVNRSTDSRSREGITRHFTQHSLGRINNSAGSLGPPRYRKDVYKLGASQGRVTRMTGPGALVLWGEAEKPGLDHPGEEVGAGGPNSSPQCLWGGQ